MRRGRRIGESDSESGRYEHDHYLQVLLLNFVFSTVNLAIAVPIAIWFIRANYYSDDSFSKMALLSFPVFFYLCVASPFFCIWMWRSFFQLPAEQRHILPPFVLSLFELTYGVFAFWLTWIILSGL